MPISLLFWIVFIIAFLFYGWGNWPFNRVSGSGLVLFILIFLLGWKCFGFILTT